jgi:hypothetical protein
MDQASSFCLLLGRKSYRANGAQQEMGTRLFCLYVCLLLTRTGLNLSARLMPELEQQNQNAASGAGTDQEQGPPATGSAQLATSQQQLQGSAASNRTPMTSADLTNQLNQPEATVKNHILVFQHKSISGDLQLGVEQLPVQFRVEFHDCEFQGKVAIEYVVFGQSVVFDNVIFDKTFQFENGHVKGDLHLYGVRLAHSRDPSQPEKLKPTTLQLNQSQVDGDVRIKNPEADTLEAENLTAANIIVSLAKSGISELDFRKLDTGRVSIVGHLGTGTRLSQLQLSGSRIRETLTIQNLALPTFLASDLTAAKGIQFLPQTLIGKRLDFSSSNLGSFEWAFPGEDPFRLPENLDIEGATFSNLQVASEFSGSPKSEKERENRWRARHTDYGLAFLEKATYFESAYTAYEVLMKSRGRGDAADAVYFAMRDRRRYTEWGDAVTSSGRAIAGMNYVIGFGHKWLFGYGRSWVYPIVWCVAFIIAGAFVFRNVALMEKEDEQPASPFSSLWYTIDLFVPVLSLGVANRWHPRRDRRFLMFYAKLLSLAGLVFLSASLGALTGSLK